MSRYDEKQVFIANKLLKLLQVDLTLYLRGNRLRGRSKAYTGKLWDGEVRLSGMKNWIRHPPISGGTMNEVASQVVRWLRDMPRWPLPWWEYLWKRRLTSHWDREAILKLVSENGVAGEDRCVVPGCGGSGTSDWWDLNGVSGPCCQWKKCQGVRK